MFPGWTPGVGTPGLVCNSAPKKQSVWRDQRKWPKMRQHRGSQGLAGPSGTKNVEKACKDESKRWAVDCGETSMTLTSKSCEVPSYSMPCCFVHPWFLRGDKVLHFISIAISVALWPFRESNWCLFWNHLFSWTCLRFQGFPCKEGTLWDWIEIQMRFGIVLDCMSSNIFFLATKLTLSLMCFQEVDTTKQGTQDKMKVEYRPRCWQTDMATTTLIPPLPLASGGAPPVSFSIPCYGEPVM